MNIIQFRSISVSFGCMYFFIFQSLDITASFLTSHRLNTKICTHRASQMEWKCGKCLKSTIFEGKLQVFISYLSEMKMVSMYYNSFLFQYFLQLVTTIFLFWRYLNSSMTSFWSDILPPFPNSNDLNSHVWVAILSLNPMPDKIWCFKTILLGYQRYEECKARRTSRGRSETISSKNLKSIR